MSHHARRKPQTPDNHAMTTRLTVFYFLRLRPAMQRLAARMAELP